MKALIKEDRIKSLAKQWLYKELNNAKVSTGKTKRGELTTIFIYFGDEETPLAEYGAHRHELIIRSDLFAEYLHDMFLLSELDIAAMVADWFKERYSQYKVDEVFYYDTNHFVWKRIET